MIKILLFVALIPFSARAEDLKLENALGRAMEHSPKILSSRANQSEQYWKRMEAVGGFLPSLSATANYLATKKYLLTDVTFGTSPNPVSIPSILPTTTYALTAQLPIFDGFASNLRYSAAVAAEGAANSEYSWTKFQVEHEVALQFYRALAAKLLKEVADQNVNTLEDHLKDTNLLKRAGVSTNFDVLRVEVQVSEAKSEQLNAEDNIEVTRGKLAELIGETSVPSISGELPIPDADLIKKLNDSALEQRADLIALESKASAANDQESAGFRFWVPKLYLFGNYQYYNNRDDSIADWNRFRSAYNGGVAISWNIFDGLVSVARAKQGAERRAQAELALRSSQLRAHQDLALWKRKYLYFCTVYRSRKGDVEKAKESVRLAKEGRRVGARTNTDLLDAEAELYRARAGMVNAQLGTVEALLNLELASGQSFLKFNL